MLSSYRTAAVAGIAASAMLLAGCGSSSNSNSPGSGSSGSSGSNGSSGLKIGMAYDIGGRGDKSFNDAAAAGLDAAKAKYHLSGSDVKELEAAQGEAEADKETR